MTARANATELLIAVPGAQQDLYALHQRVWDRVICAQAVEYHPTILYRRDKGLVRIRVSNCAMHGGQPAQAGFREDEVVQLDVRLVFSRNGEPISQDLARSRVCDLIERGGMDLIEMDVRFWRATGRKQDMFIELGVADVEAKVRVREPETVARSWRHGIGRGKRFGFGMMVFKT